ncbi:hypothetical protein [Pseudomonas sp. Pseusp97]|uniref:hypothetical protein n=1 Tax=Pseudomonas sp. Pseusp97 TaxID=3243065 RepID=UPI0039A581D3
MSRAKGAEVRVARHCLREALPGALLLSIFAFLMQWKFGFGWADEGLLWYGSQRVALGDIPLLDFFSYDPARYYWNAMIFRLAGDDGLFTLLLSCSLFGALGLAAAWYALCRARIPALWRLSCVLVLLVGLGFPRHKIFEQSLSLILVCVVFETLLKPESAKRWMLFGLATGVAAIFGRNHGVFFVAAAILTGAYLVGIGRKNLFFMGFRSFSAGVIVGYLPMILLFLGNVEFRKVFVDSVLLTSQWQLPLPIPFPWRLDWHRALTLEQLQAIAVGLLCLLVPALYVTGGLLLPANGSVIARHVPERLLLGAASIAGLPYLHQAFDRADFGHIAQSILPVVPVMFVLFHLSLRQPGWRRLAPVLSVGGAVVVLLAWIPSEPIVQMLRAQKANLQSVQPLSMGNKTFLLYRSQADFLETVRTIAAKCSLKDGEFMAAPSFPGLYAFLRLKAPFWEMYYLYERAPEFQRKHIAAIGNTQLILLAPENTVDYLERLKLANTYGLLLTHIREHYQELSIPTLPAGTVLFAKPGSCVATLEVQR